MTKFTITEIDRIESAYNAHSQISGEKVVWLRAERNKSKILIYEGKKTYEIVSPNVYGKSYPKISNNNVVWQRYNLVDNTTSIVLATLNDTESSSTLLSDRPTQIISTSAIAIFGLVFVYLLKKLIARKALP